MATKVENLKGYRAMINNWWISLILGILFVGISILVFFKPGESYLTLSLIFALLIFASGIAGLFTGISTPVQSGKGWLLASGIIEILLGAFLLCVPGIRITVLPFILGFWLMFRGFLGVGISSDMMGNEIKGAGWFLFLSIVVIILSFALLINPIFGYGWVVIWLGLALLIVGINFFVLAFYLYRLKKHGRLN